MVYLPGAPGERSIPSVSGTSGGCGVDRRAPSAAACNTVRGVGQDIEAAADEDGGES